MDEVNSCLRLQMKVLARQNSALAKMPTIFERLHQRLKIEIAQRRSQPHSSQGMFRQSLPALMQTSRCGSTDLNLADGVRKEARPDREEACGALQPPPVRPLHVRRPELEEAKGYRQQSAEAVQGPGCDAEGALIWRARARAEIDTNP